MENIAHALVGWRIGQLEPFRRVGPRAPLIGLIAANLPDIDVLLYVLDQDLGTWEHRGFTHSLLGWPVVAGLGAWISSRLLRTGRFADHVALWTAAVASHALLDVPTTWGTQLLWPNDERFGLELVFIVDPMFWLLLGALPWWLGRRGMGTTRAASTAIMALAGWYGVCGAGKALAVAQVTEPVAVMPGPFAPLAWTAVSTRADDPEVRRYWLTPWSAEPAGVFVAPRGAAWDAIVATHTGERDAWMSVSPAILREAEADGVVTVGVVDLAYSSWLDPNTFRFGHVYTITPNGEVTRRAEVQSK